MSGGVFDEYREKQRQAAREAARKAAELNGSAHVNGSRRPAEPGDPRLVRYAERALESEIATLLAQTEGERNDQLNRSAFNLGQLIGAGHLGRAEVEERLHSAGVATGLGEAETIKTTRSGIDSGMREPRTVELGEDGSRVIEVDPAQLADQAEQLAKLAPDFWTARELLAHVHLYARARMVSPWAVLGATLARVLAAVPYSVTLPAIVGSRASLNTFVGLVGRSGTGKGAALSVSVEAIVLDPEARAVRIASGEAITHVFKRRIKSGEPQWADETHAALIEIAEIDRLGGQQARAGSTIAADLRSAWSGELLGQVAADPSRSMLLEAHQYRLCLVAGIQPHRAGVLLDDSDGGTPQRFTWLPALDPDAPATLPDAPAPLPVVVPGPFSSGQLIVCAQAEHEIVEARRAQVRGLADPLDGHALLARLKIAAALGLAEARLEVTDEDWALAEVVARCSEVTRGRVVEALRSAQRATNRARAEAEAERDSVREQAGAERAEARLGRTILARLAAGPLTRGSLRRMVAGRDRGLVDLAIERLLEAGAVRLEQSFGKNGQAVEMIHREKR